MYLLPGVSLHANICQHMLFSFTFSSHKQIGFHTLFYINMKVIKQKLQQRQNSLTKSSKSTLIFKLKAAGESWMSAKALLHKMSVGIALLFMQKASAFMKLMQK